MKTDQKHELSDLVATDGNESISASKLVALFPRTEVLGSEDHEVPRSQDREVPRSAGDHLEAALAHLNRLSMMGELAASLAHEIITQPSATARNNAIAAMRFLDRTPPGSGRSPGSAQVYCGGCRSSRRHHRQDPCLRERIVLI